MSRSLGSSPAPSASSAPSPHSLQERRLSPLVSWGIVGAALLLSVAGYFYTGRPLQAGQIQVLTFSFAPADQQGLECRGQLPGPKPDGCSLSLKNARVVPAGTTSGELFLLNGVFSLNEVKEIVRQHRKGNRRFALRCRTRLQTLVPSVDFRFDQRARFQHRGDVWLLQPESCQLSD